MEVVEDGEGQSRRSRCRVYDDVWAVNDLKASLEDRASPVEIFSKRLRQVPFVLVKTVSGNTIRVKPFQDNEEHIIRIEDVKRCLVDDFGMELDSMVLIFNKQNVTNLDQMEVESGSMIYAILRVGCHESKPGFLDRSQC